MSSILAGLNETQKKAVTHLGSPLLLLAGAGSGKTRVLTHRAAFFIEKKLAVPSEILLLTFTNKAANEMKERMAKLLPKAGSPTNTGNLLAGTFHSFCCRILRADGSALGINPDYVIYDSADQEGLVKSIVLELGFTTNEFKPSSVMYFIEDCKNKFISPADAATTVSGYWSQNAARVYQKYQSRLRDYQALDFNDLLFKAVELFLNHPQVLQKYQDIFRYVLVDEYQDTNQIQYLLTKLLAGKYRQITAVGDASQAIYGWRGADYRNLVSFTTDFKDAEVINLEENYRSTQVILNAANSVISKNTSHPVLKLFTKKSSRDLIKLYEADSEIDEAEYISEKIQFINHHMGIPYRNIAVLYRMNAQSRVLEESFF